MNLNSFVEIASLLGGVTSLAMIARGVYNIASFSQHLLSKMDENSKIIHQNTLVINEIKSIISNIKANQANS